MAISFGAAGSVVTGTGVGSLVLSPVGPASTANSINLLVAIWKTSATGEPTVAATLGTWTRLAFSDSAVDVATGADVGSMGTVVYYSLGSVPTGNTVTFPGTVNSGQAVIVNYTKATSEAWTVNYSTGQDETYGANYSAAGNTDFDAVAGDYLVACSGINSDAGAISARAITATGLTLSANTSRVSNLSTDGDDSGLLISDHSVSSGTQTAAPTYAHTNASSTQGTTVVAKLHVIAVPTVVAAVVVAPFAQTAGYRVTVTGLTGYSQFQVTATDDSGVVAERDVRGGQLQSVDGSSFVGDDYEFNFGNTGVNYSPTITYKCYVYSDSLLVGTGTDTINQSPVDEWEASLVATGDAIGEGPVSYLSVPLQPALNIPVMIQEFDEYQREGTILSNSHVLGRKNPVVSTDVMAGRTGNFILLVPETGWPHSLYCPDSINDYISVLETGYTFMLRNLVPWAVGIEDFYFVVKSVQPQRLSRMAPMVGNIKATMAISVEWIEVDMPPSEEAVSALTWQVLVDNYQSWAQVLSANPTWLDILQNG